MAAPVLNTPLVLEAPERVVDSGGGVTKVWTALGTIWADIKAASGRETDTAGREAYRVTHRVTVRSAPLGSPQRPRPECRLRSGDRLFAIHGVAPADGRGHYLTCWTEEGPFS